MFAVLITKFKWVFHIMYCCNAIAIKKIKYIETMFSFLKFFPCEFHIMSPQFYLFPFPSHSFSSCASFLPKGEKSYYGSCSVSVFPKMDPFVHTTQFANIHCNNSIICYEASDFCYPILTGTPLKYPITWHMS